MLNYSIQRQSEQIYRNEILTEVLTAMITLKEKKISKTDVLNNEHFQILLHIEFCAKHNSDTHYARTLWTMWNGCHVWAQGCVIYNK